MSIWRYNGTFTCLTSSCGRCLAAPTRRLCEKECTYRVKVHKYAKNVTSVYKTHSWTVFTLKHTIAYYGTISGVKNRKNKRLNLNPPYQLQEFRNACLNERRFLQNWEKFYRKIWLKMWPILPTCCCKRHRTLVSKVSGGAGVKQHKTTITANCNNGQVIDRITRLPR